MTKYSNWHKWSDRCNLPDKNQPGVYFIAFSDKCISGESFKLLKEIIYIGMTVSKRGINGRLNQFEKSMKNLTLFGCHGGAERVRFKHKNYETFAQKAYVAVLSFPLTDKQDTPRDWRQKGCCAKSEYMHIADYLEQFSMLPEFNDQEISKKK